MVAFPFNTVDSGANAHVAIAGGKTRASVGAETGIVTARDIAAGAITHGGIVATGHVASERIPTEAVIERAGCLAEERPLAECVAGVTGSGVVEQRIGTNGSVVKAGGIITEGSITDGRVEVIGVSLERTVTDGCIAVAFDVIGEGIQRQRHC